MSFSVYPYTLNRNALQRLFGLRNTAAWQQFEQQTRNLRLQLQDLCEQAQSDLYQTAYRLFQGDDLDQDSSEARVFTYQLACHALGTPLDRGFLPEVGSPQLADLKLRPSFFWPFAPPKNFPLCYSLSQSDLAQHRLRWSKLYWEENPLDTLLTWLDQAQSLGQDLVIFVYFD